MAFKDRVCCICYEHKKFLGSVNAGKKLYCTQCQAKITKEYGSDYWKPCSFEEFLESMTDSFGKKSSGPVNLLARLREQCRQFEEEEKNKEKK